MGEHIVILPGGAKYKVEAESKEEAFKLAKESSLQEGVAKRQSEFEQAPPWTKPFMAANDAATVFADSATLGMVPWGMDKAFGGNRVQEADVARAAMGPVPSIGMDLLAGGVNPLSLPRTAARLGGGKLARGAVGLLAGTTQGAAEGAISAATRGESIPGGAGVGALAGGAGTGISHAMSGVGNRLGKWWSGIDDTLPPANPKARAITPSGQVERAIAGVEARPGGGTQSQFQNAIADISQNKAFAKKPDVQEKMQEVIHGDPATRGAKWLGNAANQATIPSALTMGGMGSITGALASAVGLPAIAGIANAASKGGTKASVEDLRRMLANHPKYKGILSPESTDKLSSAARRALMNQLEEEQGY